MHLQSDETDPWRALLIALLLITLHDRYIRYTHTHITEALWEIAPCLSVPRVVLRCFPATPAKSRRNKQFVFMNTDCKKCPFPYFVAACLFYAHVRVACIITCASLNICMHPDLPVLCASPRASALRTALPWWSPLQGPQPNIQRLIN